MVSFNSGNIGALLPREFQQDGGVRHFSLHSRVCVSGVESCLEAGHAGLGIIQAFT